MGSVSGTVHWLHALDQTESRAVNGGRAAASKQPVANLLAVVLVVRSVQWVVPKQLMPRYARAAHHRPSSGFCSSLCALTGAAEIATAEEKIAAAVAQLEKIDTIKTAAAKAIQKNATKIDSESTGIRTAIQRELDQALAALGGASASPVPGGPAGNDVSAA